MKTFQQFCEDAASQYRAGELAYQSSAPARLAARRAAAYERSRTRGKDFAAKSKQRLQAQKERHAQIRQDYKRVSQREDLQLEQVPVMKSNEYNKQIARRQATQKSAHIKHVHSEIGAEARAQQAAKQSRLKTIMSH
jgi:hypothetical protein